MKRQYFFIALSLCSLSLFGQGNQAFPVKEGVGANYLFFSDEAAGTNSKGKIVDAVISRSINNGPFREAGRIKQAATINEFKQIAGNEGLRTIQVLKKLSSEQEAWDYVKSHPKFSDYGILAADVKFMEAMGAIFVDRNPGNTGEGTQIRYRAEVKLAGSEKREVLESAITLGTKPLIEKPRVSKISESDSTIIIQWTSSVAGSPDALFGDIYRKQGNYGAYEKIGKTFANKDAKQQILTYAWKERSKPNTQYYYVVIPVTLVGLPGPASDTAAAISKNFRGVQQTSFMSANDTSSGIILKWEPVNSTYYSGMIIERSRDPKTGYAPIDTISSVINYYLDDRILPNIQYHYRIRMITFRQNVLDPSAFASAIHKGMNSFLEAPEDLKAESGKYGIRLSWNSQKDPQLAGYYVYRSHPDSSSWELISNLVNEKTYVDSSVRNSRYLYRYTVRGVNFDDIKTEMSNIVFARIGAPIEIIPPIGLQAAADGQRVLLRWNDIRSSDAQVIGYSVYRKKAWTGAITELSAENLLRAGFEKLNPQPVSFSTFTDKTVTPGNYVYGITAVHISGAESDVSVLIPAQVDQPILTPVAEIYVRSIKTGVAINWDLPAQSNTTGFAVYRRSADSRTPEKIATVDAGTNQYTDTKTKKDVLYFYTVTVVAPAGESAASGEKGIRW